MRLPHLRTGHQLRLIEGSLELFPTLVMAIEAARREVLLETYIFDFTGSSQSVAQALARAAGRGVRVRVLVDGFGTPALPAPWREHFERTGVQWLVYAPVGSLGVAWPGSWRRLHRKLCLIDDELAFCGGINVLDDLHDPNHGPLSAPRLDFTVEVRGPLVTDVGQALRQAMARQEVMSHLREWRPQQVAHSAQALFRSSAASASAPASLPASPPGGGARAALLLRDNVSHRSEIERAYLRAIARAREEVIIANAYFVPGRRLRKVLVAAARRGVRVVLLLQGRYEYFMQYYASRPVYEQLLAAGVDIHEYSPSFLHAKVAVIDGRWATVGSSNLDPLSLLLAREANVVVEDTAFAGALRARLLEAIARHGQAMDPARFSRRPWRQRVLERLALGVMRLALAIQGKRYL